MAKTSGSIRNTRPHLKIWNGKTDDESIVTASVNLAKHLIKRAGWMDSLPKTVSAETYDSLLKSGEYVEVYRGAKDSENEQLLRGAYHFSDAAHTSGGLIISHL